MPLSATRRYRSRVGNTVSAGRYRKRAEGLRPEICQKLHAVERKISGHTARRPSAGSAARVARRHWPRRTNPRSGQELAKGSTFYMTSALFTLYMLAFRTTVEGALTRVRFRCTNTKSMLPGQFLRNVAPVTSALRLFP